ncbi:putative protein OS=Cellulomonas persica OX=76861 GN=CPE01_08400 PE=4 SV=1 [Cellulomonas persica]
MAYGAPEGATGATAYSIEIAGADGSGATSIGKGVAALALFAAAGVVGTVVRRRTA